MPVVKKGNSSLWELSKGKGESSQWKKKIFENGLRYWSLRHNCSKFKNWVSKNQEKGEIARGKPMCARFNFHCSFPVSLFMLWFFFPSANTKKTVGENSPLFLSFSRIRQREKKEKELKKLRIALLFCLEQRKERSFFVSLCSYWWKRNAFSAWTHAIFPDVMRKSEFSNLNYSARVRARPAHLACIHEYDMTEALFYDRQEGI